MKVCTKCKNPITDEVCIQFTVSSDPTLRFYYMHSKCAKQWENENSKHITKLRDFQDK